MSLTAQNLLDISEAIALQMGLASDLDWIVPSPLRFGSKTAFWNTLDAGKDSKAEIETGLIKAAWLRYLDFEDEADIEGTELEVEGPTRTLIYEILVFHEGKETRVDEEAPVDEFEKQLLLTHHEHVAAIFSLVGEFQGATPVAALAGDYSIAEIIGLQQADSSESGVACEYIPSVAGEQTRLECRVRIQMPC